MRHRVHARAAGVTAAAVLLLLAGACRRSADTLPTERRIALEGATASGVTLGMGPDGRAWIGLAGNLVAVDSAGRVVATATPGGDAVPDVVGVVNGSLLVRAGAELMLVSPDDGAVGARWPYAPLRAAAADPTGRWVYAANEGGGVVSVDARTLEPRAGWPEVGREAVGAAVSALADRVYLSVAGDDARGDAPEVQVRDAQSGRVLATLPQPYPARDPAASPQGLLYACAHGEAFAYRHVAGGLERAWERPLDVLDGSGGCALRLDAEGRRVAAFSRGAGGGLALLDAADGQVLGVTPDAPLDAAFGPDGRLFVLEGPTIRVVP
jgi:hypothetical protein